MRVVFAALLAIAFAGVSSAADFSGKVTKVHDGDTAHVQKSDGTIVKVRFVYVDTPEIDQPWGIEARDFVSNLILGEQVDVKSDEVDQHGRALGEIIFNGESINKKIIENGHGWWFYHYHNDTELGDLETKAKSAKKGLWAAHNPIYPRNWRDGARVGGGGSSGGSGGGSNGNGSGGGSTTPTVSGDLFIMGAMPNPRQLDQGNETVVIGNRKNAELSLSGWTLVDDDGGSFALDGTVPASGALTIKLDDSLQLGNSGDKLSLKDGSGNVVHELEYGEASAGEFVLAK